MAEIRVLDQKTINQIAAGEVIERPSSVVKELAENAMDAKATMITVEIKEGGIDFIRITDNGFGIEKEQVETAFLPHATSKIKRIEDLLDVSSLGFRGEALASIASVAKVEVITKTDQSMVGVRYQIEGGQEIAKEEIGCPAGTTFLIRHLFYNTPARRKFLKSKNSEAGYIEQLLYHLALSHPSVAFKLIVNSKNKMNTNGNGSLKDVIYQIYGKEVAFNLIAVKTKNLFMKIEGFIGKPVLSRGNRQTEMYFINGRYIKSKLISKAIEEAYKSFTMVHKYPFTVLHIEIKSELLDVNVHPAKMEVRIKREEEVYSFLYTTIREALNKREMIPDIPLSKRKEEVTGQREKIEPFETRRNSTSPYSKPKILRESEDFFEKTRPEARFEQREKIRQQLKTLEEVLKPRQEKDEKEEFAYRFKETNKNAVREAMTAEERKKAENETALEQEKSEKIKSAEEKVDKKIEERKKAAPDIAERFDGLDKTEIEKEEKQLKKTDKVEGGEQLTLFDEEKQEKKEKYKIIGSLFDTYWLLEGEDKLFMLDQHAAHEKVMFEKLMAQKESQEVFEQQLNPPIIVSLTMNEREMIEKYKEQFLALGFTMEEFGNDEYCIRTVPANLYGLGEREVLMEMIDQLCEDGILLEPEKIFYKIATMACKAAVKGKQHLSLLEAQALVEQLMELENPYTCPHGRPVFISMSKKEIEKMFKRIQS